MPTSVPGAGATLAEWLEALAAPAASPAGGAAAALGAALAAAAVEKVAGMTLERDRYADVHPRATAIGSEASRRRAELAALARRDAEAFGDFGRALALPRTTEAERAARDQAKRAAVRRGAELQLELLRHAAAVAELATELAERGLATAVGDAAAAGFLTSATARSAYWAVRADVSGADDPASAVMLKEALELVGRAEAAERRIRELLEQRIP